MNIKFLVILFFCVSCVFSANGDTPRRSIRIAAQAQGGSGSSTRSRLPVRPGGRNRGRNGSRNRSQRRNLSPEMIVDFENDPYASDSTDSTVIAGSSRDTGPPPGSVIIPANQQIPRPPDIVITPMSIYQSPDQSAARSVIIPVIPNDAQQRYADLLNGAPASRAGSLGFAQPWLPVTQNYAAAQQPIAAAFQSFQPAGPPPGPPPGSVIIPANQPLPRLPVVIVQPQPQVNNPQLPSLYTRDRRGQYVPILKKDGSLTRRYGGGIYVQHNGQIMNVHKPMQRGHFRNRQLLAPTLPRQQFTGPLNGLMTITKKNQYKYILFNRGVVTQQYSGGIYMGIVNNGVVNYVPVHKNMNRANTVLGRRQRGGQGRGQRRRRRN